jgi:hypothetical protein
MQPQTAGHKILGTEITVPKSSGVKSGVVPTASKTLICKNNADRIVVMTAGKLGDITR